MTSQPPSKSLRPYTRRDFLKAAALGVAGLALPAWRPGLASSVLALPEFPDSDRLGRVCEGMAQLRSRPDPDGEPIGVLYEDSVVPWLREVVGQNPTYAYVNQRWVETPQGFVHGKNLQPVHYLPNQPLDTLPNSSRGPGMWAEVTVPYVETVLENAPSPSSWVGARVEEGMPVRLYYSQVFWVDGIRTNSQGQTLYRVNPNFYGGVDMLWAAAEAFRPLTPEDIAPIHPDAENKRILVDIRYQHLICYEGDREVYFCRVSTGAKYNNLGAVVDRWATPVGQHTISRKFISLQMSGGTTGASYDLPGIGWTVIFATGGVALHSTFWHNGFGGDALSHGCVNASPTDARWIFRWTDPYVSADPGMLDSTLTGQASTRVVVTEG